MVAKKTVKKKAAAEPATDEKKTVSAKEFVQAYLKYDTYKEVADALGLKEATVTQRFYNYKKKKINLKPKTTGGRGRKPLTDDDISDLNKMIASHEKG